MKGIAHFNITCGMVMIYRTQKWETKTSSHNEINKILSSRLFPEPNETFSTKIHHSITSRMKFKCECCTMTFKWKIEGKWYIHANCAKVKHLIWFKWNQNNYIVLGPGAQNLLCMHQDSMKNKIELVHSWQQQIPHILRLKLIDVM